MPLFSRNRSSASAGRTVSHAARTQHVSPPMPAPGATASTLLKRYRPLETRATGGFGSVEVCLDARLQRRVAIKRIPLTSDVGTTPESTPQAALAEARTASLLQHPNIVSVIDFTYDSAYAYLVMEYIDGMSLEEFLAGVEGNSLTYDECACIADALVQALQFAHENGVLHLDIKPANVLIDRSGHVKLTDFGMATLTCAAGFGDARGGTIGYMPPEQLRGEAVDERSDVFALAAVLYESLCATAPFRAGTASGSLKRIERGVIYPSSLLADIPENTERALINALNPDPSGRIGSVAAFGDEFLDGLGNAREGRKSLARIIARLTADDEGTLDDPTEVAPKHRVWELDPAEGYLGSRTARARTVVTGALAGIAAAACIYPMLTTMGFETLPAFAAAAAIGAASAIAPAMGSALVMCGFLIMMVNTASSLIASLPVAVVSLAIFAGWWYAWGRTVPAASTVLNVCMALCAATSRVLEASAAGQVATAVGLLGSVIVPTLIAAGPVVALAGYFLPPVSAAASCAVATMLGGLLSAARAGGGSFAVTDAGGLRDVLPILIICGVAALAAAATSAALSKHAEAQRDSRTSPWLALGIALPGIMVVLLLFIANTMENGTIGGYQFAAALGAAALSSIIVTICVYMLGYRRDIPEGD